jgi:hypothetical protein
MCAKEKTLLKYLMLRLLEIKHDEIVVGEICVGQHQADAIGGSGGWIAVDGERGWHYGDGRMVALLRTVPI